MVNLLIKYKKLLMVFVFCAFIYTPMLIWFFTKDIEQSLVEKRVLNKMPEISFSMTSIKKFPQLFTDYYSDHFGCREELNDIYFQLMNFMGIRWTSDDFIYGKDGWLFLGNLNNNKHNNPIGHAMHTTFYTKEQLKLFAKNIQTIKNWLSKKNIEYYYLIAPNKHSIYFDKMPSYLTKKNKESATDQLVQYLRKNTDVNVIDLRGALLLKKQTQQLYYKHDTHWNFLGANVAQYEIAKIIAEKFPNKIAPRFFEKDEFEMQIKKGGDLANFARKFALEEENPVPIFRDGCKPENDNPENSRLFTMQCATSDLKAIIFRDSFFLALEPYITRYFKRSTYIWSSISFKELNEFIEKEQPHIVINEMIERTIPYYIIDANGFD